MKKKLATLPYELGGIGDIKKKTLRFSAYAKEPKGSDIMLNPVYKMGDEVHMTNGYPISSQELLLRLCNLYTELRYLPISEQADAIMTWCISNVHPYYKYGNQDFSKLKGGTREDSLDCLVNVLECYQISTKSMVRDITKLYEAMITMHTLTLLLDGEEAAAKQYYMKSDDILGDDLYAEWMRAAPEQRDTVAKKFFSTLPQFTMVMELDEKTGRPVFCPKITSAIDAAYYALMRLTVVNAGTLDDWGGKNNVAFCEVCGRMFIKRHGQKYCGAPECTSEKNRRKTRDYRDRKKLQGGEI